MQSPDSCDRQQRLQDLLREGREFQCEWGPVEIGKAGMTNHLPMALIALYRLGASIEQLDTFFESYLPKLRPLEPTSSRITAANYKDHFGTHRDNGSWVVFFREEVETRGLADALVAFLPELIPGIAAAALHPMIRLGYALDIDSKEEAIHALAAWGYSYTTVGLDLEPGGSLTPEEVFLEIQNCPSLANQPLPDGLITGQLIESSERPSFEEVVCKANLEELHLRALARLARLFYLSSEGDFTALHCATSLHAYRNLLPYLSEKDATQALWPVLCAAYISRGTPDLREPEPTDGASWDEVVSQSVNSNRAHVIKAVYTSLAEGEHYGEMDTYLPVARMELFGVS